jgi:hypothetical protein
MTLTAFARFTPQDTHNEPPAGQVCYENIGPRQRRRRAWFGHAAFTLGVVLAVALVVTGAPWWTRLLVFGPFAGAFTGWLQARERT